MFDFFNKIIFECYKSTGLCINLKLNDMVVYAEQLHVHDHEMKRKWCVELLNKIITEPAVHYNVLDDSKFGK